MEDPGTIYLLHFDTPYKHAQHYLGWTSNLEARLERHRNGTGARLMEVIKEAGIGWELAETWTGDRNEERRLKNLGGHRRKCPICQEAERQERIAQGLPVVELVAVAA